MVKSKAEQLMEKRAVQTPEVSNYIAKNVSQYRRELLEDQVKQGDFKEPGAQNTQNTNNINYNEPSLAGVVTGSSIKKFSQSTEGGTSDAGFRGSGGTVRQIPEVYSPLWLNSNLNLPRDRATVNAWSRSFYALNPIVQNAISLHSTYPISKLNIKCKNRKVENFFSAMVEETDLMNICVQIAQEYWILGEAFVYGELDENTAKWSRFSIHNPDYVVVQNSVIAGEPIISLRPDEHLKRVVFSNRPSDVQQRKQLDPNIVEHIRRGENIPLNNFYVSHLARRISPYEIRGTGLIVSCFRALMLFDQLRESKYAQAWNMVNPLTLVKIGGTDFKPGPADLEGWREVFECHDEETEVLTDQGFKKFDEVIEYAEVMDGTFDQPYITDVRPKPGIKVACFNPDNEQLEYHEPTAAHLYDYSGEMYHFDSDKVDVKVTPNHKMWVSELEYEYHGHRSKRKSKWGEWKSVEAKDLKLTDRTRFRSKINWEGNDVESVNVCGKEVPIELYLEFLGYLISEGCLFNDKNKNPELDSTYSLQLSQTYDKFQKNMSNCMNKFASCIGKKVNDCHRKSNSEKNQVELWVGSITGKELYEYFAKEVGGKNGNVKAQGKIIPRWVLNLKPELLNILLKALVDGDGSEYDNPKKKSKRFAYYTTSKQLSDDVYELVYKCGYVPIMFTKQRGAFDGCKRHLVYTLLWYNFGRGEFPSIYKYSTNSRTKEKKKMLKKEDYDGKVWCFTVPTGLFVTRRNGRITIHSNSAQFDKDFKIFTHNEVEVERVGWQQGIYDTSTDVEQLIKEIYIGLMVPQVLMDGSDTTYANGSVALDVLRQRYMQFRQMLTLWLKRKVFAPISKLNDFYEYEDGEKKLIIPEIDWNHMSLFDMFDYIQQLANLAQGTGIDKKVSLQTLYRSLGLDYEAEIRKMRYEDIQDAIKAKEQQALQQYSLPSLRSLGADDEIEESEEEAVPGEESPFDKQEDTGGGLLEEPTGFTPPKPPSMPSSAPKPPESGGGGREVPNI